VPTDLRGKRVGLFQYGSSGAVFMPATLEHDYGVRAEDIHWFMGGEFGKTTQLPFVPLSLPEQVKLDFLAPGQSIEDQLEAGELDALLSLYIPMAFQQGAPHIVRLFRNYKEVEQEYYGRTHIFPIMHTVVVREDVAREYPWALRSIYKAFCEARDLAVHGMYDTDALRLTLPWLIDHVEETWRVFGKDFWAYGVEPNRLTLEALGQYLFEQGLAPHAVSPDELFAPNIA
jgi:4,5-dihydroxyphthalate decarboxylase